MFVDRAGNVAMIAALTIFPLTLVAGGLLDLQRQANFKGDLQAATDAATIVLARAYIADNAVDLNALVDQTVRANVQNPVGTITSITAARSGTRLTVRAAGEVETSFLKLATMDKMNVRTVSSTTWGKETVEIALVLDNTASMLENGKFDAMKTASKSMVDTIGRKITLSQRKFAVVPFSNFVNVGPARRTEAWMDGQALSPVHSDYFNTNQNRFDLFDHLGVAWPGCVETRPAPFDISDAVPTTADPGTLFVPAFHPDEPDNGFIMGWSSYPYANSYLTDSATGDAIPRTRHTGKYASKAGFDQGPSLLYSNYSRPKGPQLFCDLTPISPLTTNKATALSALDAMVAVGSTNIPEGLAWGWRVLSPTEPFTEGRAYGDETKKYIVLLTDGTNSVTTYSSTLGGAYSSWGYPYSGRLGPNPGANLRNGLDTKLRALCTAIKTQGIQIFTIGLMIDDAAGQQLLSDCSSGPDFYFNTPSADELQSVFDRITENLMVLRLEE